MKKTKINNTYYIILMVLSLSFLMCFFFIIMFITKSGIDVSGYSSEKNFLKDIIAPFFSVVSAIIVYLAFQNQNKQRRLDKADKSFDRCMKLIDETEKYLNKITINLKENKLFHTDEAIRAYAIWLKAYRNNNKFSFNNSIDFERNLFLYLSNVAFALNNIDKLRIDYKEYYLLLNKRLTFTLPNILEQVNELSEYEDIITMDYKSKDGIKLYDSIMDIKYYYETVFEVEENKKTI